MNKTTNQIVSFLAALAFAFFTHNALARTSVWKVSKGDDYFYVGGTVHLLSANDHPLPVEFNEAYADVSEVFFETDLDAAQTPEFQAKMAASMSFTDDRTLASELDAQTYQKLEEFLALRMIPVDAFDKIQPWAVSLTITMLEYQRLGMMSEYGVDSHFNKRALADNKPILGLETVDQQLGFLESMSKIDPDEVIEYTLRDLEQLPEFIQQMKEGWRKGDLDASETDFATQLQRDFPEVYQTIVTNRNHAWMEQLPLLFEDSNKELVLVGAMHLSGEEGLLSQLKKLGFDVEQL